jgi:hypothetical protein
MRRLLVLGLLAGCDQLFDLEPIEPRDGDVASDSDAMRDAPIDAVMCPPTIIHDEDNDGLDDSCDGCPTVMDNPPTDSDGDGLPDACDTDFGSGNHKILAAWMFTSPDELTNYFNNNGAYFQLADNGRMLVEHGATIETITSYVPVKIELRMAGIYNGGTANEVVIHHGGAICHLMGADCMNSDLTGSCVDMEGGGGSAYGPASSQIFRAVLYQYNNRVYCRVDGPSTATVSETLQLTFTQLQITTSVMGGVPLRSIVIYGLKP